MKTNVKLKKYLEEHGITQAFLCRKTGLSSVKLSNIINGNRKLTADELITICKALNVSTDTFLED